MPLVGPSLPIVLLLAARPPWLAPTPEHLSTALAEAPEQSMEVRLEALTRPFVGAPYVLSPLGEGEADAADPDPRLRLDAFDCTTFVETALALSRAPTLEALGPALDALRYRGAPSFSTRRHLTESAWIPDLIAAGVLEDITQQVGGAHTVTSTFALTAERWRRRSIARTLRLPDEAVPLGDYRLPWIPIAALASVELPPGTIVSLVREDVAWSPTRITHQGLVVRDPRTGHTLVRHASPVAKRVVDEPLENLVRRYLHPRVERKWRPVGVNVLRVRG